MSSDQGPWSARAPQRAPPPRRRAGPWLLLILALIGVVVALYHAFPEAVSTGDDWARVAYAAGLVVVVSAGIFRAGPGRFAQHLTHVSVWAAIVAVLALGFAYRDELAGVPQRLRLAFSTGEPVETRDHRLVIPQDQDGAFMVVGRVNGQRVRFLVDTGSTDTVLNLDDARRLGIDPASLRFDEEAETANGKGHGARYVASRLEVGPIAFDRFPMSVNQAPMPSSLLGLSFLNQLNGFEVRGRNLILTWRDPAG